jgi:hypothetical protein
MMMVYRRFLVRSEDGLRDLVGCRLSLVVEVKGNGVRCRSGIAVIFESSDVEKDRCR